MSSIRSWIKWLLGKLCSNNKVVDVDKVNWGSEVVVLANVKPCRTVTLYGREGQFYEATVGYCGSTTSQRTIHESDISLKGALVVKVKEPITYRSKYLILHLNRSYLVGAHNEERLVEDIKDPEWLFNMLEAYGIFYDTIELTDECIKLGLYLSSEETSRKVSAYLLCKLGPFNSKIEYRELITV